MNKNLFANFLQYLILKKKRDQKQNSIKKLIQKNIENLLKLHI